MNASNRVLMLILVSLGIIALVGCGASKQDYEKAVSELDKTKAELAQANTKIADLEKSLNEAQAQLKGKAGKPGPETGMQGAASQKETAECGAKVDSLTKENSNLKALLDKLKAEVAELKNKLGGVTQKLPLGGQKKE